MADAYTNYLDSLDKPSESVDKLFDYLQTVKTNESEIKKRKADLDRLVMSSQAEAVQSGNPVMLGYDQKGNIIATKTPADLMQAFQDVQIKRSIEAKKAEIQAKLSAIDEYNKRNTNNGELPNPDDPTLVKAYTNASGDIGFISQGAQKEDIVKRAASAYPSIKQYQSVKPIVESYFQNEPNIKSGSAKQTALLSALKSLESSRVSQNDLASQQSISDKFNALIKKASTGGGLGQDLEDSLRTQLITGYNSLGNQYNESRKASLGFSKIKLGPKGIDDVLPPHKDISFKSNGTTTLIDEEGNEIPDVPKSKLKGILKKYPNLRVKG